LTMIGTTAGELPEPTTGTDPDGLPVDPLQAMTASAARHTPTVRRNRTAEG
jgi:hypothetical protein